MCPPASLSCFAILPMPLKKSFSMKNGRLITRKTRQSSVLGFPADTGLNQCPGWERLSQGMALGRALSPFMARDGLCLCPQAKKSSGLEWFHESSPVHEPLLLPGVMVSLGRGRAGGDAGLGSVAPLRRRHLCATLTRQADINPDFPSNLQLLSGNLQWWLRSHKKIISFLHRAFCLHSQLLIISV